MGGRWWHLAQSMHQTAPPVTKPLVVGQPRDPVPVVDQNYGKSVSDWTSGPVSRSTVQITFIFIDFRVCDFAFKTHLAFRVLNAFYFQTDFKLRFRRKWYVRLTCKPVWCILHRTYITQMAMPLTSHIIAKMDLTSGFGNISFEWN